MKKKILAVLALAILLALSMAPSAWAAIVASGECGAQGDNVTWVLDDTGTLTISGQGAMADYAITGNSGASWEDPDIRSNLQIINIQNGVTTIGNNAFSSTDNLIKVNISNSVTSIGDGAFWGCAKLVTINIPDSVTQIGDYAFNRCANLIQVELPIGLLNIGTNTFAHCKNLKNIYIPASVTNIAIGAFSDCEKLTDIYYAGSQESWNDITTNDDNIPILPETVALHLNSTGINQNVVASGDCGAEGDNVTWVLDDTGTLTISGQGAMKDYNVTEAPWYDEYCRDIKNLKIENGITVIGNYAFYYCSNLTEIVIPNSVIDIGDDAFKCNYALCYVEIPDSVLSIGRDAFSDDALTNINIPASVISIGGGAFSECDRLKEIKVDPDNSAYVSVDGVLYNKDKTEIIACPGAKTEITLPSTLKSIGYKSFSGCSKITNVVIPDTVTTIGYEAFAACRNLINVNIPVGVTNINYGAFKFCDKIQSINIPANVTMIASEAFWGCTSLEELTVDSNNSAYCSEDNVLFNKNKTRLIALAADKTEYIVPETVSSIDSVAFSNSENLTKVTISPNVSVLKNNIFLGCEKIKEVFIPASITKISSGVFDNCPSLTDVYYAGSEIQWQTIEISSTLNENLLSAQIHYNCTMPGTSQPTTVPVTSITLNQTVLNLEVNGIATLTAVVAPENATNKSVRWSSNNTAVATVNNGQVSAVAPGTATITVTTEDGGKTATCQVTVTSAKNPDEKVLVTNITLDKTEISMLKEGKLFIDYTVNPANATNKELSWSVDNPDVILLTSSLGVIEALKPGAAIITFAATDGSGVKAECKVNVTASTVPGWEIYNITFDTDGGKLVGAADMVQVTKGQAYKMPNATKSRHTLTAWAIGSKDSKNTVKANDVYTFTADTTVYAIWQYNGNNDSNNNHRPSNGPTTPTKPGNTEKPGDTNKPGSSTGSNTVTAANISNVFADVQNNAWYSEAIAYVYNKGMMNGTQNGFEPNAATTRAMLVTMLHRLENEPSAAASKFSDVASGQWFSNAVAWAAANGVVNGYENGTFGPNDFITREQLAAILYRFAQLKGYDVTVKGDLSTFSDAAQVSGWAQEAVQWAVGAGIINGDNGALKPAGNATRAEVAMMLMRYIENVAK